MKGHFTKRGCYCGVEDCDCGKTWSFVIDVGRNPKNGRRKQKTKGGFKTKEDAELAAAALLNEYKQGTYIEECNTLFKDFAEEWFTSYIKRTRPALGTTRLRKYQINKLSHYFAYLKMSVITEDMYQAALDDLKKQGLSKNTLDGIHVTGRMIFEMANRKRMIKINPTEFTYIPRDKKVIIESDEDEELIEDELPKYLEKEDLAHFLNSVKKSGLYMDELTFTTLAYTGMRVGELVVLKWKDIDFQQSTINISKAYYNEKNNTRNYSLVPTKTIKSKRRIPVGDIVMSLLKKHKLEQNEIIHKYGDSYYDRGYVLPNLNRYPGYPVTTKHVRERMYRVLDLSGFEEKIYKPHSLRHTHTSLLAEAEVDINEIMDRLGHIDEKTTRKVYLHVTNVMKREATDKFEELMRTIS